MTAERVFRCGISKYYAVVCHGYLIVQRQGWFERTFIGYARNLGEAVALIKSDARSSRIRAA
jgi:hypothetical protein